MIRTVVATILVAAAAAILLVAVWPQLFGLQAAPIIAQVVSLRGLDVIIALGLVLVFGLIAIAWRGARRFFGVLVALLLVFCVVTITILGIRGIGGSTASTKASGDLTVLSWNTQGAQAGVAGIARLALDEHADIIALPETTQPTGIAVAQLLKAAGRPMYVYSAAHGYIYESHATTLLISAALGKYTVDTSVGDTAVLSSIVARPDDGVGPVIAAVHAVAPRPGQMRNWQADLGFLSRNCTGSDVIMAGDFNSTIDELTPFARKAGADFGECRDAALAARAAAVGTWPTSLPAILGAQIDHVLFGSAWKTVAMRVIQTQDGTGSLHRPVVATLAPAN